MTQNDPNQPDRTDPGEPPIRPRATDPFTGQNPIEAPGPSETGRPSPGGWPMPAKLFLVILAMLFALAISWWMWGPWAV